MQKPVNSKLNSLHPFSYLSMNFSICKLKDFIGNKFSLGSFTCPI